jgi:hypothetical protein
MKKFITLIIIFLFVHSFCLYADDVESFDDGDPLDTEHKKPFRIEERAYEIGIAHVNVNFANNFLSIKEVFQDIILIDIDRLSEGFMVNLGLNITPFYFSFKSKKGWGFGLSTDMEAVGILGLSGKMLSISEAVKEDSDVCGALFASATIDTLFNVEEFKINVNPSLFYTLAYLTPSPKATSGLVYTLDYSKGSGTIMCVDYDMRLYTGIPMDGGSSSLTSKPGLDFSIGAVYPLAKELGLDRKSPLLDFDVGVDFINIPLIASKITDYKQIKGRIGSDEPIKFIGDDDNDDSFLSSLEPKDDSTTGKDEIQVYRPFKMIVHADWRPFGSKLLTVTPVIGFCYNTLYFEPFSFEIGINGCLNLVNFFLFKIGFNYTDRMYINSIGIAFNLRAFEFDIGADLRSQAPVQSWIGDGLGVNVGFKFGW